MLVPEFAVCSASFISVAVFGSHFEPTSNLVVRFGPKLFSRNVEYHCSTSLLVTLSISEVLPGEVMVSASNDGYVKLLYN